MLEKLTALATDLFKPAAKSDTTTKSSVLSSLQSSAGSALSSLTQKAKGVVTSAKSTAAAAAQKAVNSVSTRTAAAAANATFGKGAGEILTKTGGVSTWTQTYTSVTTWMKDTGTWYFNALFNFSDANISTMSRIFAWSPFLLIFIGVMIYLAVTRGWFKSKAATAAAVAITANTLNAQTANAASPTATGPTALTTALTPSGNTTKQVSPDEYTLLSLQPLTIKQAGFVGPLPTGSFDPVPGVSQALRSGFRFLTLQIDYLDIALDTTQFAAPNIPTLIYRGNDGSLVSTNSADIAAVTQMIANLAFRPEVPNYTEPIMIYLHIVRAPKLNLEEDKYIDFLSKIATALNPLAPTHLNTTPLGIFTRQKQEETLINTPLSAFAGQTIILCNADTSIFRTTSRQIAPADDLDYWTNMRVYQNLGEGSMVGVARPPATGVTPSAIVVPFIELINLAADKLEDNFIFTNKSTFVIAMTPPMDNPSVKQLDVALNTFGVNVVPLDIFATDLNEVVDLVGEYSGMSFRPKLSARGKPATSGSPSFSGSGSGPS
jgi:hypothetical protein